MRPQPDVPYYEYEEKLKSERIPYYESPRSSSSPSQDP